MSPVPLSVSIVQIAISSSSGERTELALDARQQRGVAAAISARARLMRAEVTRVRAYSSKLLAWNMPRWRRSKASTAPSGESPAKGLVDHRARDAGGLGVARHAGEEGIEVAAAPRRVGGGGQSEKQAQ